MSETEANGVPDNPAPATAAVSADATEHKAIGVIESVEEAVGGAEKWVDDLQRTVKESTDSAMRSARSLRENSTSHFRSIQVCYHCLRIEWQQFFRIRSKISRTEFDFFFIEPFLYVKMVLVIVHMVES